MTYDARISSSLDRARERAERLPADLTTTRLIVFSDHHKGKRDGADDFIDCERPYRAALGYYLEAGYTLYALGDVEELWECPAEDVLAAYRTTLELEAAFHDAGRYLRFFGNHDDDWESTGAVSKHLRPMFRDIEVREAVRLLVRDGGAQLGEIVFVHGHQGTRNSDKVRWLSRPFVRLVWRPLQRLTKWRLATPAKNFQLRAKHDRALYRWAASRPGVVLVAGHTHKPVFIPERQAPSIERRLEDGRRAGADPATLATTRAELEWWRSAEELTGEGAEGLRPCYFNAGCCSFADGDCTGIEIADGEIRLVRWSGDYAGPHRAVLRRADLRAVLTHAARP